MDEAMQRYFAEKNVAGAAPCLGSWYSPARPRARNFFAGLFKKSGIWT